jgi:hypothetical protein
MPEDLRQMTREEWMAYNEEMNNRRADGEWARLYWKDPEAWGDERPGGERLEGDWRGTRTARGKRRDGV